MYRLAVERPEIDRMLQKTQRNHRLGDVQHDRIADVRQGDAVADGGGRRCFTCQVQAKQNIAVDRVRQRQQRDERPQRVVLARRLQPIIDAAHRKRGRQVRHGLRIALEAVEQFGRNLEAVGGRPLQKLGPMEAVLPANVLRGQPAPLDPSDQGGFRRVEEFAYFAQRQLHGCLGMASSPKPEPSLVHTVCDRRPRVK